MSPRMWSKQIPHQQQMQHLQQHPRQTNLPKDFSNYIYPSSGDELAAELDEMKIDERRRIPTKHRQPSISETDDNGHETDFTMPK